MSNCCKPHSRKRSNCTSGVGWFRTTTSRQNTLLISSTCGGGNNKSDVLSLHYITKMNTFTKLGLTHSIYLYFNYYTKPINETVINLCFFEFCIRNFIWLLLEAILKLSIQNKTIKTNKIQTMYYAPPL